MKISSFYLQAHFVCVLFGFPLLKTGIAIILDALSIENKPELKTTTCTITQYFRHMFMQNQQMLIRMAAAAHTWTGVYSS